MLCFCVVRDSGGKVQAYGSSVLFGSHAGVDYSCVIKSSIRYQYWVGAGTSSLPESLIPYPCLMPSLSLPDTTRVVFCPRYYYNSAYQSIVKALDEVPRALKRSLSNTKNPSQMNLTNASLHSCRTLCWI